MDLIIIIIDWREPIRIKSKIRIKRWKYLDGSGDPSYGRALKFVRG